MKKISVIIPCYNEEEMIRLFYNKVTNVLQTMQDVDYELIFINDGSADHTLDILKATASSDSHCLYYSFSRNFGKEAAMYAGLTYAKGDYCVIMDADLQHPPEMLVDMFQAVDKEGYDCCAGKRIDREGEGGLRNFLSRNFYRVVEKTCKLKMEDGAGDFRMMNRVMVDAILELKEQNRYMKGIFSFVGFDTKWIDFHNVERAAGTTKWSFKQLFAYACDGIFSFTAAPLTLAGIIGVLLFIISFVLGMSIAVQTLLFGNPTSGWTTIVCLVLFLSGLQLLFVAILGQYVSKTYMESKVRPVYIIKESNKKAS